MDLKFLAGKNMNLKYVEAFKSRGRMSKNRGYNVVCMGLLVESIFSNLILFNIWNVVWNLYLYFLFWGGEENVKKKGV